MTFFLPITIGGRDRPGELRFTVLLASQESPWHAAVVDLGAEKDEFALDHILGLRLVSDGPPR
jgi:hypothetical protein